MKKTFLLLSLFLLLNLTLLSAAQATTIWANYMEHTLNGTTNYYTWDGTSTVGDRTDPMNALGPQSATDDEFFSIGVGGEAYFEFGTLFDTEATLVEITWGTRSSHLETADIFVINEYDVISSPAIQIDNSSKTTVLDLTGFSSISPFKGLLIRDTSSGTNRDGWDVDAVGVSPVPEPTTIILFGFGLLGLAGVSRRKK